MTPSFQIRTATVEDIPTIYKFIMELAVYEKLVHEVVATEDSLRDRLFDNRLAGEVVLGLENGTPVGMALFFHNFSTFMGKPGLYLEDLYVQEQHRGRGYGKALLVHLAKIARERDCGRFEWSVLDWNTPAIKFYESLGAKPMDGWTVYRVTGQALEDLADM